MCQCPVLETKRGDVNPAAYEGKDRQQVKVEEHKDRW